MEKETSEQKYEQRRNGNRWKIKKHTREAEFSL